MSVSNHSHRPTQVWRSLMLSSDFGLLGVFKVGRLDFWSLKKKKKINNPSKVLDIVVCVNSHNLLSIIAYSIVIRRWLC